MIRMIAAAAFVSAALTGTAAAQERVIVQIDGAAVPYYLPMYVADHYGYFADEGLEVEFLYAGASDILSNIAVGNVHLGFPNGDAVIAARAGGLPVQVIHSTYQRGIGATLFMAESGIEGPEDLPGKTVAVTSYGSPNYIQLQVMLAQSGLSIDDVTVEIVGTGAILETLTSGQVDAIVFSMLRYYALQAQGFEVGMIQSDDYLPSHGNVLVASEGYLAENGETAAAFIRALDRALDHVIGGDVAAEVALVIGAYTPTFVGQEEIVAEIIEEIFVPLLWQSDNTAAHGYGYGDLESWQATIDIAVEYDVIPVTVDAAEMVRQPAEIGG